MGESPQQVGLETQPGTSFLLGLPFHAMTMEEAVAECERIVDQRKPRFLITANLDFVAQARENDDLREIFFFAHRVLCDGMPIVWISRLFRAGLPERVAGSDLVFRLFALADRRDFSFFLLGSDAATLSSVRERLSTHYPKARIADAFSPPVAPLNEWPNEEILDRIKASHPDILLVAVGCPKQERWISRFHAEAGVPLSIGIGASLDFISGRQTRAPRWMQKSGLEWVWRLCGNPQRLLKRYSKDGWYFLTLSWKQWQLQRRKRAAPAEEIAAADETPVGKEGNLNGNAFARLYWNGSVDRSNLDVHPLPPEEAAHVLLDCSGVGFIDSAGAGRMIEVLRHCRDRGGQLVLLRPSPPVAELRSLFRLEAMLPVIEQEDDWKAIQERAAL